MKTGIRHLESGLKILLGHNSSDPKPDSQEIKDINASLDRSFTRLRIQAEIHGGSFPADNPAATKTSTAHSASPPKAFFNIYDAREWLDKELTSAFKLLHGLQTLDLSSEADCYAIESTRLQHIQRLDAWSEATERMTAESVPVEGHAYSSGVLYLQLYYTTVSIILKTITKTSEMEYDNYLAEFERIYTICHKLLLGTISGPPVLSFDMCIIPPLFFLVLKCRDYQLRKNAIKLLESAPHQEGMWRRDDVLAWSKWKFATEEHGRGDIPLTEPLPEPARLSSKNFGAGEEGALSEGMPGYQVSWEVSMEWHSQAVSRMNMGGVSDIFF